MASPEMALLQELIEQHDYPVLLCDAQGKVKYANRAAQRLADSGNIIGEQIICSENPYLALGGKQIKLKEQVLQTTALRWFYVPLETDRETKRADKFSLADAGWEEILQELADRNYELDKFIHRISHDIRAPLTTMLGLINIMRTLFINNPEMLKEHFENMENTVKKLDRHVEMMLDYLRTNRAKRNIETVDIEALLDACLEELRYLPNFARMRIYYDLPKQAPPFKSDPMRLTIILRNLLSNAIKFANVHKNDNRLEISVQVTPEKGVFTIKDNGIGIKPELADRVFDMFFRAAADVQGSGLGLYIVKKTVERMGGTIRMQTEYGQGTAFTITLPNYA